MKRFVPCTIPGEEPPGTFPLTIMPGGDESDDRGTREEPFERGREDNAPAHDHRERAPTRIAAAGGGPFTASGRGNPTTSESARAGGPAAATAS